MCNVFHYVLPIYIAICHSMFTCTVYKMHKARVHRRVPPTASSSDGTIILVRCMRWLPMHFLLRRPSCRLVLPQACLTRHACSAFCRIGLLFARLTARRARGAGAVAAVPVLSTEIMHLPFISFAEPSSPLCLSLRVRAPATRILRHPPAIIVRSPTPAGVRRRAVRARSPICTWPPLQNPGILPERLLRLVAALIVRSALHAHHLAGTGRTPRPFRLGHGGGDRRRTSSRWTDSTTPSRMATRAAPAPARDGREKSYHTWHPPGKLSPHTCSADSSTNFSIAAGGRRAY